MAKVTAVIDIGSNSARMAVFRRTSRFGFHLIDELRSRVRISEESYRHDGFLQPEPIERAVRALKEFVAVAHGHGARKIFCVATSAVRDAPNASVFLARVRREVGVNVRVISGEQEAFYGAVAAVNLLPHSDGITLDIGGGSTECALISQGRILDLVSLDIGTIRLKELFLDQKDSQKAQEFIKKALKKIPKQFRHERIFAIGGTARTLSKVIMKSRAYPIDVLHGYEYDLPKNATFFKKILGADSSKLKQMGFKEDRLDTIKGGTLIFSSLVKFFGAKSVVTSGVGVREGVFLDDLLRGHHARFPHGHHPSIQSLVDRFCFNEALARATKRHALELFDTLLGYHRLDPAYKSLLGIAARVSHIGSALNSYDQHHHGSYLLLHGLLYGFSHKDRAIIALLVENRQKKIPKDLPLLKMADFLPSVDILQWLSFILGLAYTLSLGHHKRPEELSFSYAADTLSIHSPHTFHLAQESIKKLPKPAPLTVVFQKF